MRLLRSPRREAPALAQSSGRAFRCELRLLRLAALLFRLDDMEARGFVERPGAKLTRAELEGLGIWLFWKM